MEGELLMSLIICELCGDKVYRMHGRRFCEKCAKSRRIEILALYTQEKLAKEMKNGAP